MTVWFQRSLVLPTLPNGIKLISLEILDTLPEIKTIEVGMLNVFLRHTSASLSINENADPDVRRDLAMALERIVPESLPYQHTLEGRDDMPAHVKSSIIGSSLNIPIGKGRLLLGTWQGIYLCEHRDTIHHREVILTAYGKNKINIINFLGKAGNFLFN